MQQHTVRKHADSFFIRISIGIVVIESAPPLSRGAVQRRLPGLS
jgi:hypothetical protein